MTKLINGPLPPPKQIRFVHNQGQPPSKRRRINAACLTCRRRKTRCAGERPTCSTCSKNGHVCLGYNEVVEKRKQEHNGATGGLVGGANGNIEEEEEEDFGDDDDEIDRHQWKARDDGKGSSTSNGQASSINVPEASGAPTVEPARTDGGTWDHDHGREGRRGKHMRNQSSSDDHRSSHSRSPMQRHTESHRVPYFRYFGPTAIVPGFKQMVVSVRDRRRSTGGSFSATSPSSAIGQTGALASTAQPENDVAAMDDLPTYDPNDPAPVPSLILSLVRTFFLHLGCNYAFLKEDKFCRMVKAKRVEPILVDAVCALAARFSEDPVFALGYGSKMSRSEFGQVFAQRAKSATVDTFPCPSVGAVQACLLMAYEGFGANQDSALWMYLGLAIRMAVDLGLQKMVGVRYQGEKDPWYTRHWSRRDNNDTEASEDKHNEDGLSRAEQREVEQERIDTFWAVFTLDRVISSGTGRPVTFRDDDFELSLPEPFIDPVSGWPDPRPHFIKIIHLYGRVSDVLNNITDAEDLTHDKWEKLAKMENELTRQYHDLDPTLDFNANNFKIYVNAGQGTTFILLHFWFHALIIILHQPSLLTICASFRHHLLPNSRELSMSSAKTIADILAFAELIDPKSFIGNPFTSQPMYIAACAFLMESVANAPQPTSRETSPHPEPRLEPQRPSGLKHNLPNDPKSTKHSLLATAANQNYQRCYNSLQQLHTYWGGVRYILTVLDQKSNGVWDCETYTHEEYESTKVPRRGFIGRFHRFENPASPNVPPIAWSLTGTTNSPNSNLTLMYQTMNSGSSQPPQALASYHQPSSAPMSAPTPPGNMIYDPIRQSLPGTPSPFAGAYPQPTMSAIRHSPRPGGPHQVPTPSHPGSQAQGKTRQKYGSLSPDDVGMPHQTFTPSSQQSSQYEPSGMPSASPTSTLAEQAHGHPHNSGNPNGGGNHPTAAGYGGDGVFNPVNSTLSYLGPTIGPMTEVITFDSQDIDIGTLGLQNEMMLPWLEYLPVMGLFDSGTMGGG